ncbi:glycosyltransferase [Aquimarina pacifica]|uniref:glycosyltransferase n=1 Tax=Aquimarina pacifica TaxID=1296415 RepID=UPI0013773AD8|nr:glycosyltransferase [Aquimarina pacifica]
MIVTERGESDFDHRNVLLKLKKNSTKNIARRVAYSAYLIFYVFKTLIFDSRVKGMKYILVHDEPIIAFVSYVAARLRRKKFIYRITHLKAEEVGQSKGFKYAILSSFAKWLRNFLIKRADAVIVMSEDMKQYFQNFINREIHCISSCVKMYDDSQTLEIPERIKAIKRKVKKNSLCYLGTISSSRGLNFIIEVIANIHAKGLQKELNIFGKGTDKDFIELREKINTLNLQNHIFLYDQIPMYQLKYVLEEARIGLSPYLYDHNYILKYNSPLKTLDYMSFGKFVVGSDIGDHLETILDSKSGEVAKNNVEDFSNSIIRLNNKLDNLGTNEFEYQISFFTNWLKENRSLDSSAKKVFDVLKKMG